MKGFGDLLLRSAVTCQACPLSQDEYWAKHPGRASRATGFGAKASRVFFVAESTRDYIDGSPWDLMKLHENELAPPEVLVPWLEGLDPEVNPVLWAFAHGGVTASDLYLTCGVKCSFKSSTPLKSGVLKTCLQEHLGVELETVKPYVIWVTGHHAMKQIALHFQAWSVPMLSSGDTVTIARPPSWGGGHILILRTEHPNSIKPAQPAYMAYALAAVRVRQYLESLDDRRGT